MSGKIEPLAYWSRWKPAALSAIAAAMAIGASVPQIAGDMASRSISTEAWQAVSLAMSVFFWASASALAAVAISASVNRLAVWTVDGTLFCRIVTTRKLPLANIRAVSHGSRGIIWIHRKDCAGAMAVAGSMMRSRADVERVLRVIEAHTLD